MTDEPILRKSVLTAAERIQSILEAAEKPVEPRLLATQVAVSGSSRGEIESRLRDEFGLRDTGPILDPILGSER